MVKKSPFDSWDKSISVWRDLDVSVPIYKGLKWYLFYMWTTQQICSGSCAPVAAPLMPVAIVSQFKRGKSTNQIKNRTQLANKSDCCAAWTNERDGTQEQVLWDYTPDISNRSRRILSCSRTTARCRDLKQPCVTIIICHSVIHPGWLIHSCAWLMHLNEYKQKFFSIFCSRFNVTITQIMLFLNNNNKNVIN